MAEEIDEELEPQGEPLAADLPAGFEGERLDKVLPHHLPEVSRARLQALMAAGALQRDGRPVDGGKALPGRYELLVPPPAPAEPEPEAIALTVLYEDAHLIVIDKPAGLAVHPAPGTPSGTLVNALLHHCAGSLSGIGGVARPGIVHRLDKDTSGVMVAAKTDAAHAGLSALFATHDIERLYIALARGAPRPPAGVIEARIGRSSHDRKKMAVVRSGGREAVTRYRVEETFGPPERPLASRIACRLQTGRTHQIRVHLASKGAPVLGDPVYGSAPPAPSVKAAIGEAGLHRQALHASVLGFRHPVTGETLKFQTPLPPDMDRLQAGLTRL
jgi:23S rRNA pseudouridine1911/1915/1917 synthase